jgi:hypothetical protein
MTADEFEAGYAARGGTSVERLRRLGRVVAPCPCGEADCPGWQSVSREGLASEVELGRVTEAEAAEAIRRVSEPTR